ncbi:NmrA family NAD(P)-binding protein [Streptosporangium sp. NPDC049248]|uniref:NmrA family NAD(P)-binding protein n=1 Tax=Streptosporangium sp. NPDC049248 TaxID=3155651 RepID=UPI00342ED673
MTRDPDAAGARALAQTGAEIVRAEMDDVASLRAATEGANGLFSVQPTVGSPGTPEGFSAEDEVRWGHNVADAAHASGVEHLVYASLSGVGRHDTEKLPQNVVSKWRIEQRIKRLGLPATFLRLVSFMENYTGAYHLSDGAVSTAFTADVPQQIMAVDDVGAFTALAFAQPGEWIGRAVDLAGDELTPVQIAAAISEAIGRPLPYVQIPIEAIAAAGEEQRRGVGAGPGGAFSAPLGDGSPRGAVQERDLAGDLALERVPVEAAGLQPGEEGPDPEVVGAAGVAVQRGPLQRCGVGGVGGGERLGYRLVPPPHAALPSELLISLDIRSSDGRAASAR